MAGPSSSVAVNASNCPSNPHSSTTTTTEDAQRMQAQRIAAISGQPGTDHVTDRLLSGTSTASDHIAILEARVAALTATINSQTTTNGH